MRYRRAAVFLRNGHALAVARVAADGRVHGAGILAEAAAHNALIGAAQRVILELIGELLVGKVVFCDDQKAARVHVDTVDDAGTLFTVDAGEAVAAVVQQGVDERAVLVPGGGMNDQPLGLVHDQHVLVLVDNVQRDVLGSNLRLSQGGERQIVFRAGLGFCVFLHGCAAAGDKPLL